MIAKMSSPELAIFSRQTRILAYSRLLVPLDGSTLAEAALPTALAFVERTGGHGTVILGHVHPSYRIVVACLFMRRKQ